jgi:GNAT superfamily N-acetyltransferase
MEYVFKLLTSSTELMAYKSNILGLFENSFDKPMNTDLWEWFYLKNVYGDSIVSLCFHDGKLIGHYAAVQRDIFYNGKIEKFLLSMTTMVHPDHQGKGLFTKQAMYVYDAAKLMGFKGIFGFPNENSIYGFRHKLDWTCLLNRVVNLSKNELLELALDKSSYDTHIVLEQEHVLYFKDKPSSLITVTYNHSIFKSYNNSVDVLHLACCDDIMSFADETRFNVMLPLVDDVDTDKNLLFKYNFGYLLFNTDIKNNDFNLYQEMILSDVF